MAPTVSATTAGRVGNIHHRTVGEGFLMAGKRGNNKFTFIELFAGIGGFRIGLEALGGTCVYANERDEKAAETYQHWAKKDRCKDVMAVKDLAEVRAEEIPQHDILTAGFPCQPFSLAGVSKKNSRGEPHGFDDKDQGHAFIQMMGLVKQLGSNDPTRRPKVLLLENVKNLRSHAGGNTFSEVIRRLLEAGYIPRLPASGVIDAASWVPQHRERMYFVCFDENVFGADLSRIGFEWPTPPTKKPQVLGDILLPVEQVDRKFELSEKLWNSHQRRKNENLARNEFLANYWREQRRLNKQALSEGMTAEELRERVTDLHSKLLSRVDDYLSTKQLEKSAELLDKWDDDFRESLGESIQGNGSRPVDRETIREWQREARRIAPKPRGFQHGLKEKHEQARTLSARYHKDGAEILYQEPTWDRPRRLTPHECGRLMGFHDRYARDRIVANTHAYRQFGNAVVPPVITAIGEQILKTLRHHGLV